MPKAQLKVTPEIDFKPFIIADADTGHGGDAHVRNLIRRFAEVGVPGYHIEDQKPGLKKCGHQGGKVLVSLDEQIKRLNAARFQLDIMRVPGIIVARTDAEAATLLETCSDERDQPYIMGATNLDVPTYRVATIAIQKRLAEMGLDEIRGHLLYAISDAEYAEANRWLEQHGLERLLEQNAQAYQQDPDMSADAMLDRVLTGFIDVWQETAGLMTYGKAVADLMALRVADGVEDDMSVAEWQEFASKSSLYEARARAGAMGVDVNWDCHLAKTPEGYYQIDSGIAYATAKSIAVAPFCDLLWMETKTANLEDARIFAEAVHAVYPDKMLAYNLSPSFNWDTTGMCDDEMRAFPQELGKMGFVFNFITYGGHQIDGLAAEEFATALQEDGMLALARLQRKLRLVESPYRTPQTLVGGTASRRSPDGLIRPHRDDESDGQGLDTVPACGPNRDPDSFARRVARHLDHTLRSACPDADCTTSSYGGWRDPRAHGSRPLRQRRCQRRVRAHGGPAGQAHPQCARSEHLRSRPAQEEAHVSGPPLADSSLPGGAGALRQPDGGQPVSDSEDEGPWSLRGSAR